MQILTTKPRPQSLSAWVLATRPKSLLAAVIPILVGSCIPGISLSEMDWKVATAALLAAMSLTIATNLINDSLDFKKGVDTEQRIGPRRATQSGLLSSKQVLAGGFVFLILSIVFALPLMVKGGVPLCLVMIISAICSYLYTGGPYPLSYVGLGELFVIIFYGLVATMSAYYLQIGDITLDSVVAGLQIGFLATVLIAINNLRDIHEDAHGGKRTLAVRFGLLFGKVEITFLVLAPFLMNFYWFFTDRFLPFLLPMTALLIAFNVLRGIWKHAPSRLYNRYFGESALLLTLFGLLLILGMRLT